MSIPNAGGHSIAASQASSSLLPGAEEGARLLAELGVTPGSVATEVAAPPAADPAHITASAFIEYYLQLQGLTLAEAKLPPLALASFQRRSYDALAEATNATETDETGRRHPLLPLALGRLGASGSGEPGATGGQEGTPVVVTRLRVGAPAAVTDLEELVALGVRDILVVGVAGSLQPGLPIGALVIPTGAIREEGTSFHYAPAGAEVAPDPTLTHALADACVALGAPFATGLIWTTDAPYRELQSKIRGYGAAGALVVEMEASALFAAATALGVRLSLLMAISDELFHPWRPGFHMEALLTAQHVAARAAVMAATTLATQAPKPENAG
ncbi:MAG TPA: nucleoside phosphorylase [Ktedonobacterales bacterium]|nr:nucleoside phosphorylase [Ktedonobacterales bacterium]